MGKIIRIAVGNYFHLFFPPPFTFFHSGIDQIKRKSYYQVFSSAPWDSRLVSSNLFASIPFLTFFFILFLQGLK